MTQAVSNVNNVIAAVCVLPSCLHPQPIVYGAARRPITRLTRNRTRKMKNRIFAIPAAATYTPVKPKMAARMAMIKKITA